MMSILSVLEINNKIIIRPNKYNMYMSGKFVISYTKIYFILKQQIKLSLFLSRNLKIASPVSIFLFNILKFWFSLSGMHISLVGARPAQPTFSGLKILYSDVKLPTDTCTFITATCTYQPSVILWDKPGTGISNQRTHIA